MAWELEIVDTSDCYDQKSYFFGGFLVELSHDRIAYQGTDLTHRDVDIRWMDSICQEDYNKVSISICPHRGSSIPSVSHRVRREKMPAWRVLPFWNSVPTQSSTIVIW